MRMRCPYQASNFQQPVYLSVYRDGTNRCQLSMVQHNVMKFKHYAEMIVATMRESTLKHLCRKSVQHIHNRL